MNIKTLKWDPKLCDFFGVAEECLPNIKSSAEIYGHISYQNCPLPDTIPIAGCLGDQQAALVRKLRAIYTRRVEIYYGIWWLKKELSMVHGTLQIFFRNKTFLFVKIES